MKQNISIQLEQLARTYWQPLVLTVLGLLVFSQLVAWGFSAVELSKVDRLISETQDTAAQSKTESTENSGAASGGDSSKPASPDQKKDNIPVKNIFRKDESNFNLSAIYLDKAVINGQVLGVGEAIQKFTVKEIRIDSVLLVDERGNEQQVEMFKGGGSGPSGVPSSNRPGMNRSGSRPGERRSGAGNPVPSSGGGFPPGFTIRGMNADQLRNMSQEKRRSFFSSLSESERQQLRDRFRQN